LSSLSGSHSYTRHVAKVKFIFSTLTLEWQYKIDAWHVYESWYKIHCLSFSLSLILSHSRLRSANDVTIIEWQRRNMWLTHTHTYTYTEGKWFMLMWKVKRKDFHFLLMRVSFIPHRFLIGLVDEGKSMCLCVCMWEREKEKKYIIEMPSSYGQLTERPFFSLSLCLSSFSCHIVEAYQWDMLRKLLAY
jgi:hypothetical protein